MKKTVENLMVAFMGESQARMRYPMFSKIAKKEGYALIASIFEETANQEKEHATWNYKMLQDLKKEESFGELEVPAAGPTTYSKGGVAMTNSSTSPSYLSITRNLVSISHRAG